MIRTDVIIVGGGPAGSTCAWQLTKNGAACIILEKQLFPRKKLCAGWITPKVVKDLELNISDYPHRFLTFPGLHVSVRSIRVKAPTTQYSIQRHEFDHWLLHRSGAKIFTHQAKMIEQTSEGYIIDDKYFGKYLVGAGGTSCPVYRSLFREINPRTRDTLVVALEQEFKYNYADKNCYLWFLENDLPGYAWYVPKENGIINVGIGGMADKLTKRNQNIQLHWKLFIRKLEKLGLVKNYSFKPEGCSYYVRGNNSTVQRNHAYIIGDAAGLATSDMGEGIGPAVESGILAADAILSGKQYAVKTISKYSMKYRPLIKTLDVLLNFKILKKHNSIK